MDVSFKKQFRKQFGKLPIKVQRQFDSRFLMLLEDPQSPLLQLHELSGSLQGQFSINITGDYRAIFYCPTRNSLCFLYIGTQSQLYG